MMQPHIRLTIISIFLVMLLVASAIIQQVPSIAQTKTESQFFCSYGEGNRGAELCARMQGRAFESNEHAERAVDMIVKPLGLRRNFVLVPCPYIQNAAAVTYEDGNRYIVYDNAFMEGIDKGANTNWASVSILAHEVGHHLQGHTTRLVHRPPTKEELRQGRENELEADEFSGFAMFKLGRSLNEAQAAMNNSRDVDDEENSTHPKRLRRLEAIKSGYENAKSQQSQQTANLNSYKISGWIESLDQGSIKRTPVNDETSNYMPKYVFPGTLYKLHVTVQQFTNGKYCDKGEMRESPYMAFRIGETSDKFGGCRSTFQGGSQVEGNQLAIYLNPRCQCN